MFAIPRTAGWLAQWSELLADPEQKIARPRQLYVGADAREFVPLEERVDRSRSAARRVVVPTNVKRSEALV
jgi:citrate synthase